MFADYNGLEVIVVAGGAYDESDDNPYDYTFVDSALLQISLLEGGATLLVANAGWTDDQRAKIIQAAEDRDITLQFFSNTEQLTNYIKTGTLNGHQDLRSDDPITEFYVFAHGTDSFTGNYVIDFGYHSSNTNLQWGISDIIDIKKDVFALNSLSVFYTCRTGNDFSGGNYAETWSLQTHGSVRALAGENGNTFVGRSDYRFINGNWGQRRFADHLGNEYTTWWNNRGHVDERPGEAYSLPIGRHDAEWKWFSSKNNGVFQQGK